MNSLFRLPQHLRKYAVDQDYNRYTPEDQAVWRFIMHQLRDFLSVHAHECYLEGLEKTGIGPEEIPRIEEIDRKLSAFGWGAVPVSGFIPPAAFMEFQSLGILPIASDMRSMDHLLYTPAPDIVHEAAGHAPILIHPEFADYLHHYAEVARKAIISKKDLDQYQAIRELSDIKEHPDSTAQMIHQAEQRLEEVNQSIQSISEAALLARMNWWTAEYGLIGDLRNPRIYGAGLLSSVGEAKECLSDAVKKIPLDVHCIDYSYDITEPQPQLFVTPDFHTLRTVLEELADKLSFRRGGVHGLNQAREAATVNTVQLNSGVQISGILQSFFENEKQEPTFLRLSGPCQLSLSGKELPGHGIGRHAHGFSSPLGRINGLATPLSQMSMDDLAKRGWKKGADVHWQYESGITLKGKLQSVVLDQSHRPQILTFHPCQVERGQELLFDPAWGEFDLAVGESVPSVFAGSADRVQFGETEDFAAKRVSSRKLSPETERRFQMYAKIRTCRNQSSEKEWIQLVDQYLGDKFAPWLMGTELLEIGEKLHKQSDPRWLIIKDRLKNIRLASHGV